MGHSFGDGVIVAAIAAAIVAYLYFGHVERKRRLEIIHQERLAAMDKGIPENTVKSYLHRARRLLHARLAERGFDAR